MGAFIRRRTWQEANNGGRSFRAFLTGWLIYKEALKMVADMVETMANKEGFRVEVSFGSGSEFEVGSADPKPLISLLLKRKRELSGLSLSQAAERLGASSRNAYARYEQGRSDPTVKKLSELLHAVCYDADFVIKESAVGRTPAF